MKGASRVSYRRSMWGCRPSPNMAHTSSKGSSLCARIITQLSTPGYATRWYRTSTLPASSTRPTDLINIRVRAVNLQQGRSFAQQSYSTHLMAMAFISSSALCAGLQSTAVTEAAPCRHMLMALQPPLVSVRHESPLPTCSTYRAGNTYVRPHVIQCLHMLGVR